MARGGKRREGKRKGVTTIAPPRTPEKKIIRKDGIRWREEEEEEGEKKRKKKRNIEGKEKGHTLSKGAFASQGDLREVLGTRGALSSALSLAPSPLSVSLSLPSLSRSFSSETFLIRLM